MVTISDRGAQWERMLASIAAGGQQLPIESNPAFPDEPSSYRLLFGRESGAAGPTSGGVARVSRPRAVPWRRILRVSHVGHGLPAEACGEFAEALVTLAREVRALRIHVELWQPDAAARTALIDTLLARGFAPVTVPRMYTHTILLDLAGSESALLASFSASCRRHIRAPDKLGLRLAPISDERFADRLAALDAETMRRTGGRVSPIDWPAMLRFAREHPDLATAVGISRPDAGETEVTDGLLGYVLGVRHGDTVEYLRAASSRPTDLKAPLLYAPAWEIMRWGKQHGARWFDFGGITAASQEGGESTSGIADFKRSFRSDDVEVGGELVFAPSRLLDRFARAASALVSTTGARER